MIRRLNRLPPLEDAAGARSALDKIMRNVEDELSGIAENPNAATSPDGRMYPPDDRFEKICLDLSLEGCGSFRFHQFVWNRGYSG